MTWATLLHNILDKYIWQIIASAVSVVVVWRGLSIMSGQIQQRGIGRYNLQGIGIFVLVPVLLLLGISKAIDSQALSALIGTIAGYLFGTRSSAMEDKLAKE